MRQLTPKGRHNYAPLSALNNETTVKMPTLHSKPRIRWLPAVIIVALTILAIILLWSLDAPQRQSRVLHTVLVLMLSFLLMLLWLLFFSRLQVESPAACVWGDCSDSAPVDRSVSGERI